MAGDSVVGALRVVLGMDTAAFEEGAKKASQQASSFGKQLAAVAEGIGLERTFEKFADLIVESFKKAIETANQLSAVSEKIGVPIDQLSALSQVTELNRVSLDQLGTAFVTLSRNMEATAGGTINVATAAFQALKINVKDASGNVKSAQDVFYAVADAFSKMENGAAKTAIAAAIFGRNVGPDLIKTLNLGSEGIRKMTDEFRAMGIVVDTDTADSAVHFDETLKKLGKTKDAIILKITAGMIPSLDKLAEGLLHSANETDALKDAGASLGRSLESVSGWAIITYRSLDLLSLPIQKLIKASYQLLFGGGLKAALATIASTPGEAITKWNAWDDSITKALKPTDAIGEAIKIVGENLQLYSEIQVKALSKGPPISEKQTLLAKQFKDELASLSLQARNINQDFINLAPGLIEAGQHFKDLDGFGKTFSTTVGGLTKLQLQLNDALFKVNAAKLTQEFLTPWEQFEQTIARINAQMASKDPLSQKTFERASISAASKVAASYGEAAQAIVNPMATAFKQLAEMNHQYAGLAKAAAIAEALVNTYVAATKALASPFGPEVGIATAAIITAAGLVNVAKISATQFATGGSFKVGGGGGIDSQLVQFRASPGEMVDVRRPGQTGVGGGEITVRGIQPNQLFTGEMVRGLFDAINAGTRDGYRIMAY